MIDTAVGGELAHLLAPGRSLAVVDQVVGAEGLEAFELVVAGGRGDHRGTGQLGELQGENRHATSTLHQHGIAWLERVIGHQCAPGGEAGGGQGRRFGVAVALGRMGKRGSAGSHLFAGVTIDAVARDRGETFDQRLAVQPVWEEGADHRIAHGELAHASTHCGHHTGAIGHGDTRRSRPPHAADHGEVVIVERVGVQAHADFAGLRRRSLAGAYLHLVVTTAGLDDNGPAGHGNLLSRLGK
ncbi:hypothetical protein D3C79_623860 [compost metagenome]